MVLWSAFAVSSFTDDTHMLLLFCSTNTPFHSPGQLPENHVSKLTPLVTHFLTLTSFDLMLVSFRRDDTLTVL